MHGATLVPNTRRDILWLNSKLQMNHTNWNNIVGHWENPPLTSASDAPVAGAYDNLGGVFTSPPVAVPLTKNRLDVFGLGEDYAVYHKTYDATTAVWTANWERLGGNFMSTPAVVSTSKSNMDLFGLGVDQGMVHIAWDGTAWSDWDELGGCFSSPPVVLPGAAGTFDIFARAIDYKLYHLAYDPAKQTDWKILGGGLLGEPVAASAPAAIRVQDRIFVFVVGDDGAMWSTLFDGKVWKPWSSLGIAKASPFPTRVPDTTFMSEPVVLWSNPPPNLVRQQQKQGGQSQTESQMPRRSTAGPSTATAASEAAILAPASAVAAPGAFTGRIDVFAAGVDGALWHNWLDAAGWQKSWESLGGSLACAPSVVGPQSQRVIFAEQRPPLQFSVLEPGADSVIRLRSFDEGSWTSPWPVGPFFTQANAFSIGVSQVDIASLRSNGSLGQSDTDNGTATLAVGRWPLLTAYLDMGNVGTGSHPQGVGMSLNRVSVELCEPFVYVYFILNNGHQDSTTRDVIAQTVVKAAEDYVNDQFKALLKDSILTGAGDGPILVASLLGAAVAEALDKALSAVFADCDGTVASGTVSYRNGRMLQQQVRSAANQQISGKIHSPGTDSAAGCGGNSDYTVTYYITSG